MKGQVKIPVKKQTDYYKIKEEGVLKHFIFQGVRDIMPILLSTMKKDKNPIIVYYDPDIDGVVAGTIARRFVEFFMGHSSESYINPNRGHGFLRDYDSVKGRSIIGVDFGITSKEMKELTKRGCTILIMDHHDCEDEVILYDNGVKLDYNEYRQDKEKLRTLLNKQGVGILINNQYKRVPEDLSQPRTAGENVHSRYLSGAGVTFECLLAFVQKFMPKRLAEWDTKEQRGMVAWTLLSDMRDIESQNARLYLQDLFTYKVTDKQALTHPNVDVLGMLKETRLTLRQRSLFEKDKFGAVKLDRNNIDFHISPLFNANFRFDNGEAVMRYLWGSPEYLDLTAHDNQKMLKKTIDKVVGDTSSGKFYGEDDDLYVFGVDRNNPLLLSTGAEISNFIGLVCNSKKQNCNVIGYVTDGMDLTRASFRGNINVQYKDALNRSGCLQGAGHEGAFGILSMELSDSNFEEIAKICHQLEIGKTKNEHPIIEVKDLRKFCEGNSLYPSDKDISEAYKVAYDNMYHADAKRVCLKYTGDANKVEENWNLTHTMCKYMVNDRLVIGYDKKINPMNGLIYPILEDGMIVFRLIAYPE